MQIVDAVGSTMDVARGNLEQGLVRFDAQGRAMPVGVATREQTAGRGQRGRHWFAPRDSSLCATFYFARGTVTPTSAGQLAFLAGLAVAEVLHSYLLSLTPSPLPASTLRIGLKWPNDVLLNGKKMGGILIELCALSQAERGMNAAETGWVALIGVGLNLNVREFPPELEGKATSLVLEGGPETAWEPLATRIAAELDRCADLLRDEGFPTLLANWRRYDETPGRPYETLLEDTAQEARRVVGMAEGVADDGSLLLRLPEGTLVAVHSASSAIQEN